MRAAASRTFWTAGSKRPMRTAMIAITTSNSISVNALRDEEDMTRPSRRKKPRESQDTRSKTTCNGKSRDFTRSIRLLLWTEQLLGFRGVPLHVSSDAAEEVEQLFGRLLGDVGD